MDTVISFIAIIIALCIWAVDVCYKINEEEGKKKEGKNMSKKIYKGYELIKAIANGEIKERDKIYLVAPKNRIELFWKYGNLYKKVKDINSEKDKEIDMFDIMNYKFELIEDETIDIESINELTDESKGTAGEFNAIKDKINELLQVLKQQEKRIKKLEDKQ